MDSFEVIWERLLLHEGKPFVTDEGREFHYEIEPCDMLRFSCWRKTAVSRERLAEAWSSMPCDNPGKLPKQCTPRKFVWTILHDTRISGLMPEEKTKRGRY